MEQNILTPAQAAVIARVANEPKLAGFYLTGGTALTAYYLGHRRSDDLDFFIFTEPDGIFLQGFAEQLKALLKASGVHFEKLFDRHQFFFTLASGELKVEFTRYPFVQLELPTISEGLKVDSQRDIAANKLMTILDRFDPKDFVDLFFLLQQFSLSAVRQDMETKFGVKVEDIFLGGELVKVRRIEALPRMHKALTVAEVKEFFMDLAKQLAPTVLQDDT